MIAWIKNKYDVMRGERIARQRGWYMNLAMFYGKQWYEVRANKQMAIPTAPRSRVRTTTNLIRPIVRTELSKLTSQKPSCTVIPATGEDEDMLAAQAGEALLEYLWYRANFSTAVMIRFAFWEIITGTSYIKTWWDSTAVDRNIQYAPGPEEDPRAMQPAVGNVRWAAVNPFNILIPDTMVIDIEEQAYVFEVYTKPVEWVKANYGYAFPDDPPAPDVNSVNEVFDPRFFMAGKYNSEQKPDSCLFIEAWIKPGAHPKLPKGGMITLCAGKIVSYYTDWPYSHGEYPYAKAEHTPTGTYYGASPLEDLNPLQRQYNKSRSMVIESANKMGRPQIVAQRGSIDKQLWTNEPGAIIEYQVGFQPPQPIPLSPIPQYVINDQDRTRADMEDISGQHQVSRGQAPGGGVQAATAISFLQEKDDSLLFTTNASNEDMVAKVARHTLVLVADYYDLPRIIRTIGTDGSYSALEFKGSQIANALDVRVEPQSSLPQSKAARQAFLMDLAKMGFIDPNQMLDLMDIGGVQKLTERIRIDQKQAQRENMKMKALASSNAELMAQYTQSMQFQLANGGPDQQNAQGDWLFNEDPMTWPPIVQVHQWDNHNAHLEVHHGYMKGQEYETLPIEVKNQFEIHCRDHELALRATMSGAMLGAGNQPVSVGPVGPGQEQGMQGPSGPPGEPSNSPQGGSLPM